MLLVVVILVFQCGVEAHSARGLLSAPPPALLLAMELLPPCSTSPAVGGESAVGGEPVVAGQPAQLDLEHIGLAVGTGSGPTDPSAVQRPDTDCTADDNDGSDMMLFPPTPTSTQPPSPRPAEPPPAVGGTAPAVGGTAPNNSSNEFLQTSALHFFAARCASFFCSPLRLNFCSPLRQIFCSPLRFKLARSSPPACLRNSCCTYGARVPSVRHASSRRCGAEQDCSA